MKKWFFIIPGVGLIFLIFVLVSMFAAISGGSSDSPPCVPPAIENSEDGSTVPQSVDEFVKSHKDAYILSWKAGGFLPSASIAQTMVENGFNFTNPSGTSFWQAHNLGGVKTSRLDDFPVTLATFGKDSVDITGTKPGTNVGDNTGGAYTWFKDYNAGIVGKAEFMAHQSLYTGAINNTDGLAALTAIYKGGWATDPSYLIKLTSTYNSLGKQFLWLDQEAITAHGNSPYKKVDSIQDLPNLPGNNLESDTDENGCVTDSDTSGTVSGQNSAPILEIPEEYKGKLTLPVPNNNEYEGNNYPFGQCTWGAFNRMAQIGHPIEWFSGNGGNGGFWWQSAQALGYKVEKGQPQVGTAVSFPGGVAGSDPSYGHIAVCEFVNKDGSILVSETNVINPGSGARSWRVISKETVNQAYFIHAKGK